MPERRSLSTGSRNGRPDRRFARANIDIGVILDIIYRNMPETKRDDVLKTAHKKSVSRLRRKLEIEGEGLVQVYKAEISAGEPEAAGPENKPGS